MIEKLFKQHRDVVEKQDWQPQHDHAPSVMTVSCCDARVPQGQLFGLDVGEHFTISNIGNRVASGEPAQRMVRGSVAYPLEHTDAQTAVVIGHTGCGAVTAAYSSLKREDTDFSPSVRGSVDELVSDLSDEWESLDVEDMDADSVIAHLVERNVDIQVRRLLESYPGAEIVGAVYDLHQLYSDNFPRLYLTNWKGETDRAELPGELAEFYKRVSS